MPLRNRSYWPLGHVSDPGDGAREDLRGPAPGRGYMVSLCLKSLPQGVKKYTLTIIVIFRMCFSFGGKLAFAKTEFDLFGMLQSCSHARFL